MYHRSPFPKSHGKYHLAMQAAPDGRLGGLEGYVDDTTIHKVREQLIFLDQPVSIFIWSRPRDGLPAATSPRTPAPIRTGPALCYRG